MEKEWKFYAPVGKNEKMLAVAIVKNQEYNAKVEKNNLLKHFNKIKVEYYENKELKKVRHFTNGN